MSQPVSVQIKLRRAFRYGYFAFLTGAALALGLLAIWFMGGDAAAMLSLPLANANVLPVMALLLLSLCVPLFLGCWLMIGKAILARGTP